MPDLRHYARQAADTVRYDGWLILLWKMLTTAVSPVCTIGVEFIFEMDLREPLEPRSARIPLDIREATLDDVDALVEAEYGRPRPDDAPLTDAEEYEESLLSSIRANIAQQYRQDLALGEKCFIAWSGDEIAHVNWTRFRRAQPILGCVFYLRRGREIFMSDAYTPPGFRAYGVHGEVNMHMLRAAQAGGHRVAYTMTDLIKTASRRGLLRLGWRRCGRLIYVIPRGLGRTFIVRLSGSLGPLVRAAS